MSSRRRHALSPSLFPFLAVLVCTLGTLILLLALVAENAATAAATESEIKQRQPPPVDRLTAENAQILIDEAEFRAQELVAHRDAQVADIEQRRDQLAHLDDHMRRLRDQLEKLNEEIGMVTGRRQVSEVDQRELLALKSQLEEEARRVAELKKSAENKTPRFVIVPHKGPNGTDRRPVYLECTANGLMIWPEGIRLPEMYLQDTVSDANPLDAALRVIRNHAMQHYGDSVAPYPLLIVRPDGIKTYVAARHAMSDWDDQFGYELVPADVKLAYNRPDKSLKKKVDEAIRLAIVKQNAIQRLARGYGGSGFTGSSTKRPRKYPTLSAASMDRQGRASGFRDHRDGFPRMNPYANSGGSTEYGDLQSSGTGSEVARRLDQHLKEAREELPPGHFAGGTLTDEQGGLGNENGLAAGNALRSQGNAKLDHAESAGRNFDQPVGSGQAEGQLADGGDARNRNMSAANAFGGGYGIGTDESSTQRGQQDFTTNKFAALPGENNPGTGESADQFSQEDSAAGGRISDADAKSNPHLNNKASDRAPTRLGASGQTNTSAEANPSAQPNAASANANALTMPNGQAPSSMLSSATPNQSASPGMTMPQMPDPPSLSLTKPPPKVPQSMREMVRRQGVNWALPENVAGAHGNAIVRTINVLCYPDRFVLLPPRGEGRIEMFGLSDGDINRATLELATAIRDRIADWGAALPGGRWQPRLDVEIMPHGERRFHQLRMLMSGSGIELEGRPSR